MSAANVHTMVSLLNMFLRKVSNGEPWNLTVYTLNDL